MNTSPYLQNLRILIAEDTQSNADVLRYDIVDALEDVHVDIATNVAEASRFLATARREKNPYQVAILDFQLPRSHVGGAATSDFSIRSEIRERSPDTIIIQISAHGNDPDIQRFQQHCDEDPEDELIFIAKTVGQGTSWMQKVIEAMTQRIHTRRIRRRLNALSNVSELTGSDSLTRAYYGRQTQLAAEFGYPPVSGAARGLAVTELCADASQHWPFLVPTLQQELRHGFGFSEIDGMPCLGVSAPEPPWDEDGKDVPDVEI